MTDMEIMQILTSDMDIFEKGKAFRKAIDAAKPSALNITPAKTRAKRGPNKAKVPPLMQGAEPGTSVALMNGHDEHAGQ